MIVAVTEVRAVSATCSCGNCASAVIGCACSSHARSLRDIEVELCEGSVLDAHAVSTLVEGAGLVFHLAAKVDLDRNRDGSVRAINVEGTRIVAEACLRRGIRMLHCSSHHALELRPLDRPLDEDKSLALDAACDYHLCVRSPVSGCG